MKKIVLLLVLIISVSCSNNDEKTYKSVGIIEGIDMTMCACCGGYIIKIDTKKYLVQEELPNKENLDLNNLPITVKLDWELKKEACDNHITVSAIEQIK